MALVVAWCGSGRPSQTGARWLRCISRSKRSIRQSHRGEMMYAACYGASDAFFFQAEDGIRDYKVTGVQTCALPIFGNAFPGTSSAPLGTLMLEPSKALPMGSARPPRFLARNASVTA